MPHRNCIASLGRRFHVDVSDSSCGVVGSRHLCDKLSMRILIHTVGTRGDVQPYVALACAVGADAIWEMPV
jgi:hypothetical protein